MMIDLLLEIEGDITDDRQGRVEFYFDGRKVYCNVNTRKGSRKDRSGDADPIPEEPGLS
jgi:hypothetical protein